MGRGTERPRIRLIRFDACGHAQRALVTTEFGLVRVRWRSVHGRLIGCVKGNPSAIAAAEAAIEHASYLGDTMN